MALLPYYYDISGPFRMMERDVFRQGFLDSPRSVTRPLEQLSKQINKLGVNDLSITTDDEKFQVSVDVQHFLPEEIGVKVVDGQVIVEGNHEEKLDGHGYVSRRFVRRYPLPKGCLPDTVESKLSSDGVLIVTAPKVLPLPSIGERIVRITRTGPIQKQLSTEEPQLNKTD